MTSTHSDAVEREVRIAARPETISADAVHKSHEAMGINLGAGDVQEVQALVKSDR